MGTLGKSEKASMTYLKKKRDQKHPVLLKLIFTGPCCLRCIVSYIYSTDIFILLHYRFKQRITTFVPS